MFVRAKDAAGDVTKRSFDMTEVSNCVFTPQPTPRKVASNKPPRRTQGPFFLPPLLQSWKSQDRVVLGQRWGVTNSEQSWAMNPEKPGLHPTSELEIPAEKVAKLV